MRRLPSHQLCQLLGIPSRAELDWFLKHHGAPLEHPLKDFERDGDTSARLWQKGQHDLGHDRRSDPTARVIVVAETGWGVD